MASSDSTLALSVSADFHSLLPEFRKVLAQCKAGHTDTLLPHSSAEDPQSCDQLLKRMEACIDFAEAGSQRLQSHQERLKLVEQKLDAVLAALQAGQPPELLLLETNGEQTVDVLAALERKATIAANFIQGQVDATAASNPCTPLDSTVVAFTFDKSEFTGDKVEKLKFKIGHLQLQNEALTEQIALADIAAAELRSAKEELLNFIEALNAAGKEKDKRARELEGEVKNQATALRDSEAQLKDMTRKADLISEENKLFERKLAEFDKVHKDLQVKISDLEKISHEQTATKTNLMLESSSMLMSLKSAEAANQTYAHNMQALEEEKRQLMSRCELAEVKNAELTESLETVTRERDCLNEKAEKLLQDNSELIQFKIHSVSGAQKEKNRLEGIIRCYSALTGQKKATFETLETNYIVQIEELRNQIELLNVRIAAVDKERDEAKHFHTELQAKSQRIANERYKLMAAQKELTGKFMKALADIQRLTTELEEAQKELQSFKSNLSSTSEERNSLKAAVDTLHGQMKQLSAEREHLALGLAEEQHYRLQSKAALDEMARMDKENLELKQRIKELEKQLVNLRLSQPLGGVQSPSQVASPKRSRSPKLSHTPQQMKELEHVTRLAAIQKEMIRQLEERLQKCNQDMKELRRKQEGCGNIHKTLKEVLRRLAAGFYFRRREEKVTTFGRWRVAAQEHVVEMPDSLYELIPETLTFAEETWDDETLQSFVEMHSYLDVEWRSQMKDALGQIEPHLLPARSCTPSTQSESIAFWNEVLRLKYEADTSNFETGKMPLKLSEFLLLHVREDQSVDKWKFTHYMLGLLDAYKQKESFAVLVSRLLQILDPSPAAHEAQIVVTQYSHEFDELMQQVYGSDVEITLNSKLPLTALLENYFDVMKEQDYVGEHWFRSLKPEEVSMRDFLIFLIYWKLSRDRKKGDDLWRLVRPASSQQIAGEQLEKVLRQLEIMAPLGAIEEASPITRQFYKSKSTILDCADYFLVKKADFLTGVLEACLAKVRRAALAAHHMFQDIGCEACSFEVFVEWVGESGAPAETLRQMYQEAQTLSSSDAGLDCGAFVRILSRRMLGSYGDPPLAEPRFRDLFHHPE